MDILILQQSKTAGGNPRKIVYGCSTLNNGQQFLKQVLLFTIGKYLEFGGGYHRLNSVPINSMINTPAAQPLKNQRQGPTGRSRGNQRAKKIHPNHYILKG